MPVEVLHRAQRQSALDHIGVRAGIAQVMNVSRAHRIAEPASKSSTIRVMLNLWAVL
jgi:hypothetical protein